MLFRLLLGASALVVAFIIFSWLFWTRPMASMEDQDTSAPRITVVDSQPITVKRRWVGYGTAMSMDAADVAARVTATVVDHPRKIEPGGEVVEGELLIGLDPVDYEHQISIARTVIEDLQSQAMQLEVQQEAARQRVQIASEDAELAKADLDRVKQAVENEAALQRELDRARQTVIVAERLLINAQENLDAMPAQRASLQARLDSQKATLALAMENLQRCSVRSPLNGVLESVDVEVGENVVAGQKVARVVNLTRIEIPLKLPAAARSTVLVDDPVQLKSDGSISRRWNGRISRISPADDSSTRTMTVYVEFVQEADAENKLVPGVFLEGTVVSGRTVSRTVLPRRAIRNDQVLIISDGTVMSMPVRVEYHVMLQRPETGLPDQDWVVLAESLPADTLVVVDAARSLPVGSAATPVVAAPSPSSGSQADSRSAGAADSGDSQ